MAQFKESYGYAVIGENSKKIIKIYSIKDIDLSSRGIVINSGDEFINCVLFNSSFLSSEDLNYFFFDLIIKDENFERTLNNENIRVVFFHKTKKTNDKRDDLCNKYGLKDEEAHMYLLPILFKCDYDYVFSDDSNYLFYSDIKNPLFGLIKAGYKINCEVENMGMISKEDAVAKNISHIYNLYNDFNLLRKSKTYTESKGLIETIYRNLLRFKVPGIDYNELYVLFEKLDDRINRNYQGKATDEQIRIVSNIRKRMIEIYYSNVVDFSMLYVSYYDKKGKIAKDLFNYIDALVKSGSYYYDSFDRSIYKNLSDANKIKYFEEFLKKLRIKGELSNLTIKGQSLSAFNRKYLLKLMDTISLVKDYSQEESLDKGFQKSR